jgi:hypothetical protein
VISKVFDLLFSSPLIRTADFGVMSDCIIMDGDDDWLFIRPAMRIEDMLDWTYGSGSFDTR